MKRVFRRIDAVTLFVEAAFLCSLFLVAIHIQSTSSPKLYLWKDGRLVTQAEKFHKKRPPFIAVGSDKPHWPAGAAVPEFSQKFEPFQQLIADFLTDGNSSQDEMVGGLGEWVRASIGAAIAIVTGWVAFGFADLIF